MATGHWLLARIAKKLMRTLAHDFRSVLASSQRPVGQWPHRDRVGRELLADRTTL
jgi:hypothetical protein